MCQIMPSIYALIFRKNKHLVLLDVSGNDTNSDPITPEVVVGQIWLQEDNANSEGVQIKELNSSNTDGSVDSLDLEDHNYPWCYTNNERLQRLEDNFKINKKARELRRAKIANRNIKNSPRESSDVGENCELEDLYINLTSNNTDKPIPLNHAVNCFTILNKHVMNSDTSSDNIDYEDIDILTPRDLFQNCPLWDQNAKVFENEVVTYDPEQGSEKRTIWIYSFKNKRLLSENDFELVNIPSNNNTSDSSTSTEKIDEPMPKDITMCRVSSPFPAPYVPKLNLTKGPTLSTLSEVTEPNKPSSSVSNETEKTFEEEFFKRKHNGWFIKDDKDDVVEEKKYNSTNVINWMALSPRERRRRFRNVKVDVNLPTLPESNSHMEVEMKTENLDDTVSPQVANVVVDVDVHTVDEDGDIKSATTPKNNWINTDVSKDEKGAITIISSEGTIEENGDEDRGDYQRKSFRKLHIHLGSKKLTVPVISDPIEKLDGTYWIAEGDKDKVREYIVSGEAAEVGRDVVETEKDDTSVSRRLWARNLCLMKPALWNEYALITQKSPVSLHLSLDSLVVIKQSWYKRLFQCFKCCRRNE